MKSFSPSALFERYGLVVLLAGVIVFFAVNSATPQFATRANLVNILGNQSILGIVAIATVIPLVAGQIDLSVGPSAGLCSVITAGFMSKTHTSWEVAVLAGVAVGILIGTINGTLVAKLGINSIITTLGTSSVIAAVVVWYSQGVSIVSGLSAKLTNFGSGDLIGIPTPFWFLAALALGAWYVLEQTPVGRYLTGVGINERAAGLVGLRVPRYLFASFVVAGACAGVAGVMLTAYGGNGNPLVGPSFTLPALAAAFLGATTIRPGRYNVVGTLIAIFFLAVSVNGLTLWGAEAWVSDLFNGVALLVAVGLSTYSGRRRRRRRPVAATSTRSVEASAQTEVRPV
jgi:ribose transport system permease protein